MKRVLFLAEKVIYIVFFQCLTFVFRPMTLQVTNFAWFTGDGIPWGAWISRTFTFLATAFVLALFFKVKSTVPSITTSFGSFIGIFLKQCLWKIVLLRLITDGLEFALRIQTTLINEIIVLVVETGFLLVMFWIFHKVFIPNSKRMSDKRKRFVLVGVVSILAVAAYYISLVNTHLQTVGNQSQKYVNSDDMLDASATAFPLEWAMILYLVALWIVLLVAFGLVGGSLPEKYSWGIFTARLLSIGFILFPFLIVKMYVLPYEMINTINKNSSGTTYSAELRMDIKSAGWTISRLTGYTSQEQVYLVNKKIITYGREPLLNFKSSSDSSKWELEWIFVNGVDEAYCYGNDAIAYLHNGKPFAIATKDINAYKTKDDCLLAICKQMVQEHNFEMLEYSYEYLGRYDKEFLKTYFSETKLGDWYYIQNAHIQESYIDKVWQEIGIADTN